MSNVIEAGKAQRHVSGRQSIRAPGKVFPMSYALAELLAYQNSAADPASAGQSFHFGTRAMDKRSAAELIDSKANVLLPGASVGERDKVDGTADR